MPLYYYNCEACQKEFKRIVSLAEHKAGQQCECGGKLKRAAQGVTSQVMETLDNGIMVRKVERLANIEEIMHERSKKNPVYKK